MEGEITRTLRKESSCSTVTDGGGWRASIFIVFIGQEKYYVPILPKPSLGIGEVAVHRQKNVCSSTASLVGSE
jgi:hypothetical protein